MLDSIVHTTVRISDQEKAFIEQVVMGVKFPWFWQAAQDFNTAFFHNQHLPEWFNKDLDHYNSAFFGHTLMRRSRDGGESHLTRSADDFSVYYEFFIELFHRWMRDNGIGYTRIFRANLNLNWHNTGRHTEPHVDHEWPHHNFIMYLNDCDAGETVLWPDDFSASYLIPPKSYTALAFKQQWHAHRYPAAEQRRIVFVVTYI